MKENIYVFYGGRSLEHEVSITSAKTVINHLDREKYNIYGVYITKAGHFCSPVYYPTEIDDEKILILDSDISIRESFLNFFSNMDSFIAFPVIHGTYGEDGTIQGFFESIDVPYVGCDVASSAICMDKGFANDILEAHHIPQAKYFVLYNDAPYDLEQIIDVLQLPIYVKPCNAGSSVGVTRAETLDQLKKGIAEAFRIDRRILLEECIDGVELQIAVMNFEKPFASRPGVYQTENHAFFDYEAKYSDEKTKLLIPFECGEELEEKARRLAERTYSILGCQGLARVDIFIRDKDKSLCVNECNTIPGMTSHSMFPLLWKPTNGLDVRSVYNILIANAKENYKKRKALTRDKLC